MIPCQCELYETCPQCGRRKAHDHANRVQPPVATEETPITVQELRDLVYPHGKAVSVLITWTRGHWQMVTAGATRKDADAAVALREQIEKLLELGPMRTIEDRRHEHQE